LERTDFKTGFAGIAPYRADEKHVYTLPAVSKARLAAFYGAQYLKNPLYLNSSVLDTVVGAFCYYGLERDYVNLYAYIPWEERTIVDTLRQEYHFELAPDTTSTWRIGDGTAAFYNFIYHRVAGFTENDTFRSNQIREGMISRDEAVAKVREENRYRYESLVWYLKTMQLDVEKVLGRIVAIPTIAVRSR
jgi:glutamine---fructose-6-phosphate transaminase (isomerizing)